MADIAALGFEISSAPIEKAESSLDKLSNAARRTETATEKMNREADNASKKMQAMSGSSGTLTATLTRMAGVITAALSVRQIQQYADTWSDLSSRVRLAIGPQEDTADVMSRLSDIARMTYSSLESTAESFTRNAMTLTALGKTTQQQLDFTEALNNALVVSGAKGMAFESAQNAIGKAMAEGTLRGDELNNILNNGGRVAQVLADELGVNVTQLRSVASEGKITGDIIYRSLIKNMETLRKEAESMPATIGDAFTLIRNAILESVGVYDQQNGLSETLAENLVKVADAIRNTNWTPYVNALTLAAKLYAAYLVTARAVPAAIALGSAAHKAYTVVLAAFTAQAAAANVQMTLMQRTLMGFKGAVGVASAAFAGWSIGTYLREEFEIVEKAGIALMSGLHQAAIAVGGVFKGLGETVKFALTSPLSFVWGRIVSFLELIQGLGAGAAKALGFEGLAEVIGKDLTHLRTTTDQEYRATIQGIVDATKSEMAGVSDVYFEMFSGVGAKADETGDSIANALGGGGGIAATAENTKAAVDKVRQAFEQTIAQMHRQLTLSENATQQEQILYEIQYGRLKGVNELQQQMLMGMAAELDMREKLKAAEAAGKEFDSVMGQVSGMSGIPELDRLNEQYAQRKEVIDRALETEYLTKQQHDAAMIELDTATANARKQVLDDYNAAQQASALQTMASIVSITSTQVNQLQGLLDESSGIGKAFFVMTQTLAAANAVVQGIQSAMAIRTAYAQMAATAGYGAPALLAAGEVHAGVAQAMGFASAGLIMGQTIAGFQSGGYTGNGGVGEIAGVVHGREYVFDAASTARIGVSNLEAIRRGESASSSNGGQSANITIAPQVTVNGDPDQKTLAMISKATADGAKMAYDRISSDLASGRGLIDKSLRQGYSVGRRKN